MEAISLAFRLIDGVRVVIAALKGETKLVVTCRQLLHSTQLYAECLQSVQEVWNDSNKVAASAEMKNSLKLISTLVSKDIELLQKIKDEVDEIFKTNNSKSLIHNAIISKWTGRIDKIHQLEAELMNRFQVITSIMVKDIFKSTNCLDEATMEMIGDVDGAVFWHSNFKNNMTTSFALFVDSYQDYISKTLFFRHLPRKHLITLLKSTLLSGSGAIATATTDTLLNTQISVSQFAQWLRRFGPMRETLTKASVVSLPSLEQSVSWFQKDYSRDQAMALIEHNAKRFTGTSSLLPHHLVILRYSSDPKNHFVITCRHYQSNKMEHFPVLNASAGYCIVGDEGHAFPTVIDLIQFVVVERLYASALGGSGSYTFPRDSMDEWDAIFGQVTAPIPEGHYGNRNALEKAMMEMSLGSEQDATGAAGKAVSYGFATLFTSNNTVTTLPSPPVHTAGVNMTTTTTAPAPSMVAANEKKIIGKYLVKQGLELLLQCGDIPATELTSLSALIDRL